MTLTERLTQEEPAFNIPAESILSRPTSSLLPDSSDYLENRASEPDVTILRPRKKSLTSRSIQDPLQVREQRYRDDESRGIVEQARLLAGNFPDSANAWARLSQTLANHGYFQEAIEPARAAINVIGKSVKTSDEVPDQSAGYIAARVLISAGHSKEVEALFNRVENMPQAWMLLYAAIAESRGDYRQALARLKVGSGTEVEQFRGYLFLKLGEWSLAIRQFRSAGGEGLRSPHVLTNLAYAYSLGGSQRKALSSARQAVTLAPRNSDLSFNYVGLLLGNNKLDEAQAELGRLRHELGDDLRISNFSAFILTKQKRYDEARSELRRALENHRFQSKSIQYAELTVNLALVESNMGMRSETQVLDELHKQIRATNGRSVSLAVAFCNLVHRTTAADEVARLYDTLEAHEKEGTLLPLKTALDFLRLDYVNALNDARKWADAAPLEPSAIHGYMTALGHFFGDFEEAINVGNESLRRIPASILIRNSLAFYMTLANRPSDALKIIEGSKDEASFLYATRGLIAFGLGETKVGLDFYDKAVQFARENSNDGDNAREFERLARVYEWIGLQHFNLIVEAESYGHFTVALPSDWTYDTSFLHARELALKLNLAWPEDAMSL